MRRRGKRDGRNIYLAYGKKKKKRERKRRRSPVLLEVQFNLVIHDCLAEWLFKTHSQSIYTLSISHTLNLLPLIMMANEADGFNADNSIPNSSVQAWFVAKAVAREIQNKGGWGGYVDIIVFSSYYKTKHLSHTMKSNIFPVISDNWYTKFKSGLPFGLFIIFIISQGRPRPHESKLLNECD